MLLVHHVFCWLHFVIDPPRSYLAWRGWIMSAGVSIATAVFFAALLVHAWIGLRDVILDYVHPAPLRCFVLALLGFGLVAIGRVGCADFAAGPRLTDSVASRSAGGYR